MRQRLVDFVEAAEYYSRLYSASYDGLDLEHELSVTLRLEPSIRAIMKSLDPALVNWDLGDYRWQGDAVQSANRAIGMIDDFEDIEERLRPTTPSMSADRLHPWVWDAARTFWEATEYVVAVGQAAKSISAHTRKKTGCPLSDGELMLQVWSNDAPKPGRPRLRLPGDQQTDTWRSQQQGARSLAQACYAGIRNVAAHEHDPGWSEQVALEYLSCLSVLARWIDEATLMADPRPADDPLLA